MWTECQANPGPSLDVTLGMQRNLFLLVTDLKYIGQIKAPGLQLRFNHGRRRQTAGDSARR